MLARSTVDDTEVPIIRGLARLRWSPDGAHVYVSFQHGGTSAFAYGRTYVVPLAPGSALPAMPPGGFQAEGDLAALPGVQILPHGGRCPRTHPRCLRVFAHDDDTQHLPDSAPVTEAGPAREHPANFVDSVHQHRNLPTVPTIVPDYRARIYRDESVTTSLISRESAIHPGRVLER